MTEARTRPLLLALTNAVLCTAFVVFFTRFPTVADEHLALPIARAAADSTLYPRADLIVSSGLTGPFHLYRLAGVLYARNLDVDQIWLAALVALLFATFAATWAAAHGVTRNAWLASLATAALAAASPYRGTLHWFLFPPGNLITSTAATPLVVTAIALAAWGRYGPALIVAALTFNLHPSMGLIAAAVIALGTIGADGLDWRRRAGWWAAAAACALPNAWFVASHAAANFEPAPAASGFRFAELFSLYAHHAWITDHWREAYGWFFMQLAGVVLLRRYLAPESRRVVLGMTAAAVVCAALWLLNLYTINYPALTMTLGMRSAPLVKLIVFPALCAAVAGWTVATEGRERLFRLAVAGLLLVATLHKNLLIGEGLAAIAWAAVAWRELPLPSAARIVISLALVGAGTVEVLSAGWGVLRVAPFALEPLNRSIFATICASSLLFVAALFTFRRAETDTSRLTPDIRPWAAVAVCAAALAFTLVLRGRVDRLAPTPVSTIVATARLAEPDTSVALLMNWVPRGSVGGSLFAVPPTDGRFDTFRLVTGRGVYAMVYDVDQLAYDAAVYGTAHARLLAQGMVVRGRHEFDAGAWDTLPAARVALLARDGVDYAVFDVGRRAADPLEFPVVYQDQRWIVYDVRSAR